jgi:hypothetical protein
MWKYANGLNTLLLHTKSIHIFLLEKKIEKIMKKIHPLVQKFFKSKLLHNVVYNWSKLGGMIPLLISSPPSSAPATAISLLKQNNNTNTNLIISESVKLSTYPNTHSNWERQGCMWTTKPVQMCSLVPNGNQTLILRLCRLQPKHYRPNKHHTG